LDGDFTNKLSDSSQIINDENTSHINVNRTSKLIVKKREIKKDPNAPKRNRSAYMFFCTNKREEVKSANPEATFGTIGKLLGENWKSLDADQKKKYEVLSTEDKERYHKELDTYNKKKDSDDE